MKYRILWLMVLISTALTAQNVFLWDRDMGYTVMNPEDIWQYVGMEYGIENALIANGINPVVDTVLPADLSGYDMIFATIGRWCDG
ncbi:MAG TPA: hypothetical protein PLD62_10770 [Candidatus Cloacimonadota bacterium]|nr:hypothetical protein [Candidatus Cloacimonadota bacterium]